MPEYEQHAQVLTPAAVRDRVHYLGPIIGRERDEIMSRADARKALGIGDAARAVYISAGGGGDANAESLIQTVYQALGADRELHLIFGAGPLYRGRGIYGDRVTWLAHGNAAEFMAAFDIAVAAAGYNSFNELMHFGVPTVLLPPRASVSLALELLEKILTEHETEIAAMIHSLMSLPLSCNIAKLRANITREWNNPGERIIVSHALARM